MLWCVLAVCSLQEFERVDQKEEECGGCEGDREMMFVVFDGIVETPNRNGKTVIEIIF